MDVGSLSMLLPDQYSYKILRCVGTVENFTALIRANLSMANDVKPWVDKFGQSMNCTFISHHSQRRKQAKIFKSFLCQLSKKNKTRPVAIKSTVPDLTGRNYDCGASIMVWIMNDDEQYASKGFPARIEIIWKHEHDLTSVHILNLLRPLKETKERFEAYFMDGHSVNSAISENEKQMDSMADSEESKMRQNRAYCPSRNVVWHWYQLWRKRQQSEDVESTSVQEFPVSISPDSIDPEMVREFTEVLLRNLLEHKDNEELAKAFRQFKDEVAQCEGNPTRLAKLLSTAASSI